MTDREYLSKDLLPGLKFVITKNVVHISSDSTSFLSYTRPTKLIQQDLLDVYSSVVRTAKLKGCGISYQNKYKKIITENWQVYLEQSNNLDKIFDELVNKAKVIQKRGIHLGCSDDLVLKETTEFAWKLNPYFYTNSAISIMNNIYNELKRLDNQLKGMDEIPKINGKASMKIFL
jgi:hypothetical protein